MIGLGLACLYLLIAYLLGGNDYRILENAAGFLCWWYLITGILIYILAVITLLIRQNLSSFMIFLYFSIERTLLLMGALFLNAAVLGESENLLTGLVLLITGLFFLPIIFFLFTGFVLILGLTVVIAKKIGHLK